MKDFFMKLRFKKGQTVLEYAVLLSVLCLVFITMIIYMKNAVRSKFLTVQDRLNEAHNQQAHYQSAP